MDLNSSVGTLSLVGPIYARRLKKLEIEKIEDLLLHVPHRYLDFSITSDISRVQVGETVTVRGEVTAIKNQYTKSGKKIQLALVSDKTGTIVAVWFNQPYLVRTLYPGTKVALAGEVGFFGKKRAFISPEFEKIIPGKGALHTGRIIPVYPETSGISSKWLRGRIKEAFQKTQKELKEFLPESPLERFNLLGFREAVRSVHFPQNLAEAEEGRRRLAFDELLFFQIKSVAKKITWQRNRLVHAFKIEKEKIDSFTRSLPFTLTNSQKEAISEILNDLTKVVPMNRLLEGDVGSGKTVVAAVPILASFLNGLQSVVMAPTQILAQQHFETLTKLLSPFKIKVALVISETKKKEILTGDVFVGTHALIQRKIDFGKVGLVVIDEQHRFGVEQRAHLVRKVGKKTFAPHVLTMTATPIPRTVALTFYGDLDLSTLKELPKGRKKITTWVVPPAKREGAYKWIKEQVEKENIQVFVVCPLIEVSEKETMEQVRAASQEYENLKKVFKGLNLGLLHGRLTAKEKNDVLEKFREGKVDILVSTPVVEVGIDVPNATIMLIEAAERFGLAQLHQLRGRVGRSEKKSYCLLLSDSKSKKALSRLFAMTRGLSGFELAELDLKLRGPGEVFGVRQHGFPELKIARWDDIELIKGAKKVAEEAFEKPKKYEQLFSYLREKQIIAN